MTEKARIRSFVRRSGRMTPRQTQAVETYGPQYVLDLPPAGQHFDWPLVFANNQPVTLEIGFGMGASLVQMAQAEPKHNFLGIEVHPPGVGALLADMAAHNVTNIRIIADDAVQCLQNHVKDNSLERALIFFPDPWPKKRHHKRRLIQADFVHLLVQKIRVGGQLHLATDWQDYAEQMLAVLSTEPGLSNNAGAGQFHPRPEYRPLTKFEKRGQRLGHGIWDLLFTVDSCLNK